MNKKYMYCSNCGNKIEEGVKACTNCGQEVGRGDSKIRYAGFWKRFGAFLVDYLVLSFVILIFVLFFETPEEVGILVAWIYYAGMESSSKQATLGKMALGIKVTDDNGQQASFGRVTLRHFGKFVSLILLIGYIMIGFTEKKQGLHDMIARCLVIDKE